MTLDSELKKLKDGAWAKAMESMDFQMFAFQRMNGMPLGNFPDYFGVVYDAYVTEFGLSEHDLKYKTFELDAMIEKLCARHESDTSKEHLRAVMRLKLENDLSL